jgi:exonuclease VII small subunit
MSELLSVFRDLRKDMKNLIETMNRLNNSIANLDKAIATMDKLQKTIEANEGNLTGLIKEMGEVNENIKTILDVVKEAKED